MSPIYVKTLKEVIRNFDHSIKRCPSKLNKTKQLYFENSVKTNIVIQKFKGSFANLSKTFVKSKISNQDFQKFWNFLFARL
jgi:hypothetical protein